jgi:hypothetical protein
MTKVTFGLISRTKLAIQQFSKSKVVAGLFDRTKLYSVVQNNRTKLVTITGAFYSRFRKIFSENLAVTTIMAVIFGKNVEDTGTVTDNKLVDFDKTLSDNYNIQDSFQRTVDYTRAFVDSGNITDTRLTALLKPFQEAGEVADQFTRTVSYFRNFEDLGTATDDVNGAAADDDQNMVFFKNTGNLATFTDIYSFNTLYNRTFSEQGTVVDSRFNNSGLNKSDEVGLTDTNTRLVVYFRYFTEETFVTDLKESSLEKPFQEALNIADSASFQINYSRKFDEEVTATDDINGALADDDQNITFFKSLQDLNIFQDTLTTTIQYYRTVNDSTQLEDLYQAGVGKYHADVTELSDSYNITNIKELLDSGLVEDNLSITSTFYREFLDRTDTTDYTIVAIAKPLSEGIELVDSVSISVGVLRYFDEALGINSLYSLVTTKALTDQTAVTDVATKMSGKILTEQTSITSSGFLVSQGYGSPSYFAEDFVGDSRTLS